jgi:hypothetical protein
LFKLRLRGASVLAFATLIGSLAFGAATPVSGGQRTAALQFLSAVASGDPQAVAQSIHPDDLRALRLRILGLLRDEAKRGEETLRSRLFGQGMPLDDIERLTDIGFYAKLGYKLHLTGRAYSSLEGLAAIPDRGDHVEVVVRGRQPKDHGKVEVVNVVTLRPFGKDWKAALPSEIEAQIEDLIDGRAMTVRGGGSTEAASPGILELLAAAEQALNEGRCEDYYGQEMSPNFRKVTGKKALAALIGTCQNSMGTRQLLLSTLHIARGLQPHYENEGQRAVYDLAGQGLPYQTFSLEQVERRWFIAE